MEYVAEPQLPLDIPLATTPRRGRSVALNLSNNPIDCARTRLVAVGAAFAGLFLIAALRLIDATLLQPDTAAALAGPAEEAVTAPIRADLTDRNGELLATSIPTQSLYADPKQLLDPEATARDLARVLPDLKYEEVLDKLKSARRFVWLKRNLSPAETLKVNSLGHPGLEFQTEYVRFYPAGAAAAHLVGYTDVDNKGLAGIERGLNSLLTGGGDPVALSLDMRLQHILRREVKATIREFRALGGAGLIMDIYSGEVLAAVSLPDFDPARPGDAKPEALFNRFALGTYELGSVFKTFTIAAGLESGQFNLNTFFDTAEPIRYGGFTINDFHPEHRALSTPEVYIYSSNIGAARMALTLGPTLLQDFITRLGLTEKLDTEIAEQGNVLVPGTWRDINAMTIAYGHGISVTPLHFLRAMAATLNNGTLINPTFLKHDAGPASGPTVFSPRTVDQIRRLMRANVVLGSGKSAEVAGYFVGGKTGTAEKTTGKRYSSDARLSSFAGAFPMQDPRYLIYVMIDEPHPNASSKGFATGGWVAAPAVGKVIAEMAPLYGIPPASADDPSVRKALSLTIRSRREQLATF